MPKDFAKSTSKDRSTSATKNRQKEHDSTPSVAKPFLAGSVFGVILCLAIQWFLNQAYDAPLNETISDSMGVDVVEEVTGPVLDFYTTLSDVEVIIPEEELQLDTQNLSYILQAGSFRDAADADAMRVQLILLNLDAEVTEFIHNDETWHRVLVGPFTERTNMAKTRTTLLENGIQSLLLTKTPD